MRAVRTAITIFAALLGEALAQAPPPSPAVFTSPELGFRYIPPSGLRDTTLGDQQWIQRRATELRTTKVLVLLLSLRSGADDTSNDCTIGMESYPLQKLGAATDQDAIRKLSRWVAGNGTETGEPKDLRIGQSHFAVSTFQLREGSLTKQAHIYTTILRGQVLAIVFSANSAEVLSRIEASIKTFEPLKHD